MAMATHAHATRIRFVLRRNQARHGNRVSSPSLAKQAGMNYDRTLPCFARCKPTRSGAGFGRGQAWRVEVSHECVMDFGRSAPTARRVVARAPARQAGILLASSGARVRGQSCVRAPVRARALARASP